MKNNFYRNDIFKRKNKQIIVQFRFIRDKREMFKTVVSIFLRTCLCIIYAVAKEAINIEKKTVNANKLVINGRTYIIYSLIPNEFRPQNIYAKLNNNVHVSLSVISTHIYLHT